MALKNINKIINVIYSKLNQPNTKDSLNLCKMIHINKNIHHFWAFIFDCLSINRDSFLAVYRSSSLWIKNWANSFWALKLLIYCSAMMCGRCSELSSLHCSISRFFSRNCLHISLFFEWMWSLLLTNANIYFEISYLSACFYYIRWFIWV